MTTRVLYVAGMGRSGSTLLERALSQLPQVCGLGEVRHLWERGIRNDERCGCGVAFSQCPFWTDVGERAFGGWSKVDLARVEALALRVDDVKYVPRLLVSGRWGWRRREVLEYVSYYRKIYEAALEVSGQQMVVDSSKFTALAYLLSHDPQLSLRAVHIVRDPRAVAYSWTKVVRRPEVTSTEAFMPRYSPHYMAFLYSGHNALLELLRLRGIKTRRVRYEDFADAPLAEVANVAGLADLAFEPEVLQGRASGSLSLHAVHTVAGNPSRFQTGEVAVVRDEKWRREMPRRERLVVALMTAPLLLFYGYLRRHAPNAAVRS